jgi:aryl-alcohol dehydrogenase-like predicted oxidoreductase
VIARVPLASGLLTGKLRRDSQFASADHRNFNRHGESFDVGETFSGVDYDAGLRAVEELRDVVPAGATLAEVALRWIAMFPEVTTAIPGARNAAQVDENVRSVGLPPLSSKTMTRVRDVYDRYFRGAIHSRW